MTHYQTLHLPVDTIHTLAVYHAGNPQGLPIIYCHGGPGSGADTKHFDGFDLTRCFVILYDQRGCGNSTPQGCLKSNTTADLLRDIEKIRAHFKLKKVLLYGGSWGSTLALAYGEKYPKRVIGFVLRSICLAQKSDYTWLYEFGANQMFPEAWKTFLQFAKNTGAQEKTNLVTHYAQQILSPDSKISEPAILAWNQWAAACLELPTESALPENLSAKAYVMTLARLQAHYYSHHFFLGKNTLLKKLHKITHLKAFIVHGEKDFLCPPMNAVRLHEAWPNSVLTLLPQADHLSSAPGMQKALQEGVNFFIAS